MQTFEQTMSAGESRRFPCGKYFFLLYAPLGVNIVFVGNNHQPVGSALGVKGGFNTSFSEDKKPLAVMITSLGDQAIKGQYSDIGEINYVRSQGDIDQVTEIVNPVAVSAVGGTVSVQGNVIERIKTGDYFWGTPYRGGTTAKYPHLQVWNHESSGVNFYIQSFKFQATLANVLMKYSIVTDGITAGGTYGFACKDRLSSNSPVVTRSLNDDSQLAGTVLGVTEAAYQVNDVGIFSESAPLMLPPGYGFTICGASVGFSIYARIQGFQEVI